jgi:hypothetical protein
MKQGLQQCNTGTRHSKVVSMSGKKEVASSAERGNAVTVVTSMNATGTYVLPLIVFPRKNTKEELRDGDLAGSVSACHPSGWIQMDMFTKWFDHFVHFVKPSADDPLSLIVDVKKYLVIGSFTVLFRKIS